MSAQSSSQVGTRKQVSAAHQSASDLAAALNAIIIESDFDDVTRAGLMATLDVAAGRTLPFQAKDEWLGRRMPRQSGVSVEHESEVNERAYAARWKRVWKLIDAEQSRTGHRFIERRRGGLVGETRDRMRRQASTYSAPLVEIVVDVLRLARQYGAERGPVRERSFRRAAREVLDKRPQDYEPEGKPLPQGTRRGSSKNAQTDGTTTRIIKAQAKLAKRAVGHAKNRLLTGPEADELRLALHRQIEDHFAQLSIPGAASAHAPACTTPDGGSVLHADCVDTRPDAESDFEPDFPPFEPAEPPASDWFFDSEIDSEMPTETPVFEPAQNVQSDFQKVNENAGSDASKVHAGVYLKNGTDDVKTDAENTPESTPDLLAQALLYASHGWQVFPVHTPDGAGGCSCRKPDCQNIGKHPRTINGLKDATTDKAQIARWWRMFPNANIGIATGATSNLLVVDVDPRHGGWDGLNDLFQRVGAVFPATPEAITGSDGRHFFFQMPDADVRNSANKLAQGVDVRANGGYVVAAPSLHASGNRYKWTSEEAHLQQLPYPFFRALVAPERKAHVVMGSANITQQSWQGGTITDGSRGEFLFRKVACAARGRGADYDGVLDALFKANLQCVPPKSQSDLEKIARSAMRYAPNRSISTWSTV